MWSRPASSTSCPPCSRSWGGAPRRCGRWPRWASMSAGTRRSTTTCARWSSAPSPRPSATSTSGTTTSTRCRSAGARSWGRRRWRTSPRRWGRRSDLARLIARSEDVDDALVADLRRSLGDAGLVDLVVDGGLLPAARQLLRRARHRGRAQRRPRALQRLTGTGSSVPLSRRASRGVARGRGQRQVEAHPIVGDPRDQRAALSPLQFHEPVLRHRLQRARQVRLVSPGKRRQLC